MSIIQGHAKSSGVTAFYPTTIDQSLRFNDADLPHLFWEPNDTPDGGGQKFTISFWMKRSDFGNQTVYAARTAALAQSYWLIGLTSDRLYIQGGYGANMNLTPNAAHRDPSAWYHVVVAADTTLATANDRVKLYINGEQVTDFSTRTNPSQNADLGVLSTTIDQYIGRQAAQQYFDGYLAEFIIVDNQQLAPTDFGETRSGIWVPKEYSGTYGEGTHLDFADSASIGNDISGNNHDWTVNNLVASDVVPDSPTNNFATLNSVYHYDGGVYLSEGNLKYVKSANGWTNSPVATATWWPSSGKWYWEYLALSTSNATHIGVCNKECDAYDAYDLFTYYSNNGSYYYDPNGTVSYGATWGVNDVIGVAYDADNGTIEFYKNGTSQGQKTGLFPLGELTPCIIGYYTTDQGIINFGQDSTFAGNETAGGNTDDNGIGDFKYAPPSGYLALCTANLPDPVIDPAQDATPEDHFNVALWTGQTATSTFVDNGDNTWTLSGVGFQPDWVWYKERDGSDFHQLVDSVRGAGKHLFSNDTSAEGTYSDRLTAFESDGFTLGEGGSTNQSTKSYVGWNWKAGGTGVANTDGSIDSTVSANTDAGFSIVQYDDGTDAVNTVGHGLTSAPEMVIVKNRTDATPWRVYHLYSNASDPEDYYLDLDATGAASNATAFWNGTKPSTTVVSLSANNSVMNAGKDYIMYCFHSVDGFSKVGSYIGNGSADGPFVYTGHRSRFLLVKRATGGSSSWYIWDTERDPDNPAGLLLLPNSSGAEIDYTSTFPFDLLSNGFKVRATAAAFNNSGNTYVFYSAAEQPFKYSNAR